MNKFIAILALFMGLASAEIIGSCFEQNTDFLGNDVGAKEMDLFSDEYDCQKECQNYDSCNYWTWTNHGAYNVCWMKNSDSGRVSKNGAISGPKFCPDKCDPGPADIVGSQSEIIPGWTNDGLEGGPWRLPKWKNVWEKCGEGSGWYGWKPHGGVGSISTTFTASGRAELSFGNCWDAGTVKVYLDGTEIASAGPGLHITIAFDFNTGAVLSIRDEGANSVIQIWYFVVLKCGTDLCSLNGLNDPDLTWFDGHNQGLGCIGLAPNIENYMNFSEARNFCTSKGYRFVEIYDQNQQDFITDLATKHPPSSKYGGYWIGLKRIEATYLGEKNTWKWLDCDVVAEFTSWRYDNGNYYGDAGIYVYLYKPRSYAWNTAKASTKANPLCQVFPSDQHPKPCSDTCFEKDIGFEGAIKVYSPNANAANDCQKSCQNNDNCDFWTWQPLGSKIIAPQQHRNCFMYKLGWHGQSNVYGGPGWQPVRKSVVGVISGPKFCD